MATFLIGSTPVYGHVSPMLAIAKHLSGRGHRIRILTGSRYEEAVLAAGLEFASLPPGANYDDRDLKSAFPEAYGKTGLAGGKLQLSSAFIAPIRPQFRAMEDNIASLNPDAVLVDIMFFGALPLLLKAGPRPAVLTVGVTPLLQASRDVASFGPGLQPMPGLPGLARNALSNALSRVLFHDLQRQASRLTEELVNQRTPLNWLDWSKLSDRCLQLTIPEFEYPRRELPANTQFVGPVRPNSLHDFQEPAWWPELQQGRPAVHVTQGTIDNADLGELIGPTLQGLADDDVLVIATTGGAPLSRLPGPLPDNARVEAFIPHDRLLPSVDVMVTNGGYGGVQFALSQGVPLVVAGDTADKPEVAARVAWSGAGINLGTGKPTPDAVAVSVRRVLEEPGFAAAARHLRDVMGQYSALDAIAAAAESYVR
jgi:MGT family glycosyltransferase